VKIQLTTLYQRQGVLNTIIYVLLDFGFVSWCQIVESGGGIFI